jgi:hypothetical protein
MLLPFGAPKASGMATDMTRLTSIRAISSKRTGGLSGSNQLVNQVMWIHAHHTASNRKSVSSTPLTEAQVLQQPVGELRHGEDEDQVEEQLQGRDPLLAPVPDSQQTSVIGDVHHIHPLSLSRLTIGGTVGLILPCGGSSWLQRSGSHALVDLPRMRHLRLSEKLGGIRGVALRDAGSPSPAPFCAPYSGQIRCWSVALTPFRTGRPLRALHPQAR